MTILHINFLFAWNPSPSFRPGAFFNCFAATFVTSASVVPGNCAWTLSGYKKHIILFYIHAQHIDLIALIWNRTVIYRYTLTKYHNNMKHLSPFRTRNSHIAEYDFVFVPLPMNVENTHNCIRLQSKYWSWLYWNNYKVWSNRSKISISERNIQLSENILHCTCTSYLHSW